MSIFEAFWWMCVYVFVGSALLFFSAVILFGTFFGVCSVWKEYREKALALEELKKSRTEIERFRKAADRLREETGVEPPPVVEPFESFEE